MSSSEEDVSMLREAVDPQFEGRFGAKDTQIVGQEQKCNGQNGQRDDGDAFWTPRSSKQNSIKNSDFNDLGTTPEFRNHVAKKLSKILDSQIKLHNGHLINPVTESPPEEDYGIRLFASSKNLITCVQNEANPCQKRRKPDLLKKSKNRKRPAENSSSSSSDEMEQLASVAVSSEWVMSKKGVYDCTKQIPQAEQSAVAPNGGNAEGGESEYRSSGHHRNVCRKKRRKDTKEKVRRNKRPSDDDGSAREATVDQIKTKKHSHKNNET